MNRVEPNRNVYVGHRYVPLLVGEWDNSIEYEGLSIVTHKGASYTSKKRTPPGIDIENEDFWVLTGNYNAQIEYYRDDVGRYRDEVDGYKEDTDQQIYKLNEDFVTHKDDVNESLTTHKDDVNESLTTHKDDVNERLTTHKNDVNESLTTYKTVFNDKLGKKMEVVNVEAYEGSDYEKIQSALNDGEGRTIRFEDNKTYEIDNSIIGSSNIELIGNNTILRVKNGERLEDGILNLNNKSNIKIRGLIFNMNMLNMPTYQRSDYPTAFNTAIRMIEGSHLDVENCQFINLYTRSIYVARSSGKFNIKNNIFKSPVQTQDQIIDHITFITVSGFVDVSDNFIDNEPYENPAGGVCGIFMAGVKGHGIINNNRLNYCGRDNTGNHRSQPIDFYGDCENITVTNNTIISVFGAFRMNSCNNMKFNSNNVTFLKGDINEFYVTLSNSTVYGENELLENIEVKNNTFISKTTETIRLFFLFSRDWGMSFNNVEITDNRFIDRFTLIMRLTVPCNNVKFNNNVVSNVNDVTSRVFQIQKSSQDLESEYGTEEESYMKNIEIIGNNCSHENGNDVLLQDYNGITDDIKIKDNTLNGVNSSGYLLQLHTVNAFILNNIIYNEGGSSLVLRGDKKIYLLDNILIGGEYSTASATDIVTSNNYKDGEKITI